MLPHSNKFAFISLVTDLPGISLTRPDVVVSSLYEGVTFAQTP